MALHGVDREVEERSYLGQLLVEHILQDDDAALHGGKFGKARHGGLDRFLPHQRLYGVGVRLIGDIDGGLDRFGPPHGAAAQQIESAVVGDPEQPAAYFGSSSTDTTFSPNSRGGIGAPKPAKNASAVIPIPRA